MGPISALTGRKLSSLAQNRGAGSPFFAFPGLPRGEEEAEAVVGFKEATGIKYVDFQERGNQLAEESIRLLIAPIK